MSKPIETYDNVPSHKNRITNYSGTYKTIDRHRLEMLVNTNTTG